MSEWTDRQYRELYDGRIMSKVVGVTKEPGYPESAFLLMKAEVGWFLTTHESRMGWEDPDGVGELVRRNVEPRLQDREPPERLAGVLIRDPENPHDTHAIEVHVPLLECRVGFMSARLARQRLARELDDGVPYRVQVWGVPNLEHAELPGIRILLTPACHEEWLTYREEEWCSDLEA